MLFSLCGWSSWYAPVGALLGNSWRIGPDDNNWDGVLRNIDIMNGLQKYAGPGGWNDPCLLLSRKWSGQQRMTELQTRAQFSIWAVLAAPLLISGSVLNMTSETLATYSNKEVIAVNQDVAGHQGWRIQGGALADGSSVGNIWAKPLSDGAFALVFLNVATEELKLTCDEDCFGSLGFDKSDRLTLRDLWAHKPLAEMRPQEGLVAELPPAGGHFMVLVKKKVDENQVQI